MSKKAQAPNNTTNGITNMSSHYAMTQSQLDAFLTELNTPSFLDNIAKLFTSPIENVISLCQFPFDVKPLTAAWQILNDTPIIINILTMNSVGLHLGRITTPLLDLGSTTISRHFNNFLDFAPYTKIELYLPYIGFETLDTNVVMGKTLNIKYAVDLGTGRCTAFVSVGTGTDETIIMTRDGQMGIQIQVAGGSGADIARSMVRLGVGATAGAVSLGAGAVAAGAGVNAAGVATGGSVGSVAGTVGSSVGYLGSTTVNAINAGQINVHKGGSNSPNNGFYAPQNAYLIYTRPVIARPSSYNSNVGRPSGKTKQLQQLTGFTVVDSVHVEGTGLQEATQDELTEIERLLKTGVIL